MSVAPSHGDSRQQWAPRLRVLVPRLAVNVIVAPLAYMLLRPTVSSDVAALAIVGAIPTAWTIGFLLLRRRLDPIGVFALVGFATALLLSLLTGENSLPLKLGWEPPVLGALGVAFLASAAVSRPLLPVILRLIRRDIDLNLMSNNAVTAIVGATLVVATIIHVILAVTMSTGSYLVVSHLVTWSIYGGGVLVLALYVHRIGATQRLQGTPDSR